VTIGAAAGAATRSLANQTLQSAFNPLSIPGCVVWMDAADTTTYTTGSAITSWTSKGTVSGTSGSRSSGTFSSTTINSLPAIAVSAAGQMDVGSGSGIPFQTTSRSIFLVVTLGAAVAGSTIYFTYGAGISPVFGSLNGSLELDLYATGLLVASSPTNFFSKTSVVAVTSGIYVNGASQTLSVDTGNTGFNIGTAMALTLGLASSTGGYTLGELMIYDGVLTNTQRQAIEGYLAWKWGLQGSLSSTNPYSTQASPAATAPPLALIPVNYLVVGGGGGGGSRFGGGGGAGGFLEGQSFAVAKGMVYTVTVGAGGAGGANTGGSGTNTASGGGDGGSSVFATITAAGGGGGGYGDSGNGRNGGSGGGGAGRFTTTSGTGTAGQGNAGGTNGSSSYVGGGGGGAGGAAVTTVAGTGKSSSITGTSITYAGGGGGGGTGDGNVNGSAGGAGGGGAGGGYTGTTTPPTAGTANTGGGGGGGAYNLSYTGAANGPNNQPGAAGGSGVVILAYPSTFNTLTTIGSGLTYTVNVGATQIVYTFTAGSGTISW
jgi:hypothetical protein